MLHNRANGGDDRFWSSDAGPREIWRMEVVEPGSHFFWRGVGEKEADLAIDTLLIAVNV